MTSAADLFALQEIDLGRDSRRALIADIESRLGETDELAAAREAVRLAQDEVAAGQRQQRDLDAQLEDLDARIGPLERKLYGGTVRNPKELSDLQRELEIFKQRRSRLDDQGLALIDTVEAAAKNVEHTGDRLRTVEEAWRRDVASMTEARERAQREVARLDDERGRRVSAMDPAAVQVYEVLRPKKAGRAVARIERGTCQGCRLSLPSHVVQRARSAAELVQCPSCERILVGA